MPSPCGSTQTTPFPFTIRNKRVATKPIAKQPYIRNVKKNGPFLALTA
jgi:hypothetical protein